MAVSLSPSFLANILGQGSSTELERLDPYKIPSKQGRERDEYRAGLLETLNLARRQFDYQIRRGRELGYDYPRCARNALGIFDETIAEYKRGQLLHCQSPVRISTDRSKSS